MKKKILKRMLLVGLMLSARVIIHPAAAPLEHNLITQHTNKTEKNSPLAESLNDTPKNNFNHLSHDATDRFTPLNALIERAENPAVTRCSACKAFRSLLTQATHINPVEYGRLALRYGYTRTLTTLGLMPFIPVNQQGHATLAQPARQSDTVNINLFDETAALRLAIYEGNTQPLQELLKAEKDADAANANRWHHKALMNAIYHGSIATVNVLLHSISDINAIDAYGDTALTQAARYGHTEIVHALLTAKADTNTPDEMGKTPLIYAAYHGCAETVHALLTAQADVNATDKNGKTPLMHARTETAYTLLTAQADVNAAAKDGKTALMYAAYYGPTEIAHALLAAQADVNATAKDGKTALMYAAYYGPTEIAHALLAAQADVNATDKRGKTPLLYATLHHNYDIEEILKNAGAQSLPTEHEQLETAAIDTDKAQSETVKINSFDAAFQSAIDQGNTQPLLALLYETTKIDLFELSNENLTKALQLAMDEGNTEPLRELLKTNADIDPANVNKWYQKALMLAAYHGSIATVNALLDAKADVNATDMHENTALMQAARYGHTEIVQILLAAKADVSAVNVWRKTPLILTASYGNITTANALLDAKADPNAVNIWGQTAFMEAAYHNNTQVMRTLLAAQADVTTVNHWGKTALTYVTSHLLETAAIDTTTAQSDDMAPAQYQTTDDTTITQSKAAVGIDTTQDKVRQYYEDEIAKKTNVAAAAPAIDNADASDSFEIEESSGE